MTAAPHPLIAAALAMPKTHKVITTYADGRVREFETRSEKTAENHAALDRRNIGRDLIDRETGKTVRVVSVRVAPIFSTMSAAQLNDWYERTVGYRPQVDEPKMTDDELRALCVSYANTVEEESE